MKSFSEDFPIFERAAARGKRLIYLDSAATAQKPRCMIEAVSSFYSERYATVHRAVYALSSEATEECEEVRRKAARFLGAESPEEILFTRGTTEAINLVARSFGKVFISPGDELLLTEIEHHANLVPWQLLAEERGARLKFIPVDGEGRLSLEALDSLLTERTRLVALSHVSNSLGTIHPIKEVVSLARKKGAAVLVDGAQAAPSLPLDVKELGVDFYAFSGHKCYGPTGIGVLYGKRELLEKMPPYQGGGDMIEEVSLLKSSYREPPLRFEAGTPMIAQIVGLGASIDYLERIGMEALSSHEKILTEAAYERLRELPSISLYGPEERGPLISFNFEGVHPLDLGTLLDLKGIALRTGHLCSQTAMRHLGVGGVARVSFGLYNSLGEIEELVAALEEALELLA